MLWPVGGIIGEENAFAEPSYAEEFVPERWKVVERSLKRAVRIDESRPHYRCLRSEIGKLHELLNRARLEERIAVEQEDIPARARADASVGGRCVSEVPLVDDHLHLWMARAHCRDAIVARRVVDDPDVRPECADRARERGETIQNQVAGVPTDQNDRNVHA